MFARGRSSTTSGGDRRARRRPRRTSARRRGDAGPRSADRARRVAPARRPTRRRARRGRPPRASRPSASSPSATASTSALWTAADRLDAEVVADQQRVDARRDREHRAARDAVGRADGLHLERVGDHEPVVAELAAQQAGDDGRGSAWPARRRAPGTRMCAVMIDCTPAAIAARNGSRPSRTSPVTVGSSRCESCSVSPWPGKCFAHAATPCACRPRDERRDVARDELGVGAERADADHRVLRIHVDVGDRREVEVDADRGEVGADRRRDLLGQRDVVDDAERARCRGTSCRGRSRAG